jgi:hypothetical protein
VSRRKRKIKKEINMKKILFAFGMLFSGATYAQNGLESIVVEKYYVSDAADSVDAADNGAVYPLHVGSTTYRVYADLLPGYKVIQMFGSPTHPLNISTTTSFYNDPNYGVAIYSGTSINNTKKNTMLIDSYLTIGSVANGLLGVIKEEDTDGTIGNNQGILANNDISAGAPITGANGVDGLMPGSSIMPNVLGITDETALFDQTPGSVFEINNATIAALGGVEGITPSNHVLLGQFTTNGTFSFKLNLQLATPVAGGSEIYVAENAVNGEIQDSTLIFVSVNSVDTTDTTTNDIIVRSIQKGFELYPNPATSEINIMAFDEMNQNAYFEIVDVLGNVVERQKLYAAQTKTSVDHLAAGLYVVRIHQGAEVSSQRFIKR